MSILNTDLVEVDRTATIIQERITCMKNNIESEIVRVGDHLLANNNIADFEFRCYDDHLGHDDVVYSYASTRKLGGELKDMLRRKALQVLLDLPGIHVPIQSVTSFKITKIENIP